MSVLTPLCLTVAEYLEWEETNEVKHEYIDGELRSMTGVNRRSQSYYDQCDRSPSVDNLTIQTVRC